MVDRRLTKDEQIEKDEREDHALRAAGHICGFCGTTLSREEIGLHPLVDGKPVCSHCQHQMTKD